MRRHYNLHEFRPPPGSCATGVNGSIKARLEETLETHRLKPECSTEKSFLKRIGDQCIDSYVVNYDMEDADNSSFEIRITYTERLRADRKMRKLLGVGKTEYYKEQLPVELHGKIKEF